VEIIVDGGYTMDKQEHKLDTLQSIITRQANNSSNCKLWCITILAAIIVFLFGDEKNSFSLKESVFMLLPLIPFMLLDAYYLGLEEFFRRLYQKTFTGEISPDIPIAGNGRCQRFCETVKSILSFSVWGFYLLVGCIIFIILYFLK
jgi:hypothetical protein